MTLKFTGWHRSFLSSLVEDLITQGLNSGKTLDLSDSTIVLPGARAGRRLLELLTSACQEASIRFSPPRFLTPSQFLDWLAGEALLAPTPTPLTEDLKPTLASDADILVAWHSVLSELSPEIRSILIAKELDSSLLWSDAAAFANLQRELSGGGYSFRDVSECLADSLSPSVGQQWSLLADLEQLVQSQLESLNLTTNLKVLKNLASSAQVTVNRRCIIAAVVDAQPIFFSILSKISPSPEIYCFASSQHSELFDDLGKLRIDSWSKVSLPIIDSQINSLATPRLEAQSVAVELHARYRKLATDNPEQHQINLASDYTICAADQAFMPLLSTELQRWRISAHFNPGWTLADSPILNLISTISEYLRDQTFISLSHLVRQTEFSRYLTNVEPYPGFKYDLFLLSLDTYISDVIPLSTNVKITDLQIESVIVTINDLLGELSSLINGTVAEWCLKIELVIKKLFGQSEIQINIPTQRTVAETYISFFELLRGLYNSQFATKQKINFSEFCALLRYAAKSIPFTPYLEEQDSIEIVGWLDILLDDAPNALVTALHEGAIPEMMTSNELLPNSIKRQLGLPSNESRLARDIYIALASLNSKKSLTFSFHRQSLDHAPLQPSALLLRPQDSSLINLSSDGLINKSESYPLWARVRKLLDLPSLGSTASTFSPSSSSPFSSPFSSSSSLPDESMKLEILKPIVADNQVKSKVLPAFVRPVAIPTPIKDAPDKLSPSAITAYLQCPYRFYLSYVLNLKEQSDLNTEIPSHIIGTLIHKVLEGLPKEGRFNLEFMTKEILNSWYSAIDQHFGQSTRNIISLLKAEGAKRLQRVIIWLYQRRLEGWVRYGAEHKLSLGPSPETHGFIINGRVDALEYNPKTNEALIIDYKLRERSENPTSALRNDGQWNSLTLPIYYHLTQKALSETYPDLASLKVAYLNLGPEQEYELKIAKWSEEDLEAAWKLTLEILGKIRAKEFWPPSEDQISFDPFQKIVGDLTSKQSEQTLSTEE